MDGADGDFKSVRRKTKEGRRGVIFSKWVNMSNIGVMRRQRRQKRGWDGYSSFLFLLTSCALISGCSQPSEQRAVDLTVPVTVMPVETGAIEDVVTATGTLRPVREAQLISEIRGALHFSRSEGRRLDKGMSVKKGQVIARLENQEWVVGARLESKKLASETAQKTLREQELLFQRGLTTEREVENARKIWQDAVSTYEDARIQMEKLYLRTPIDGVLSELTDATEGTLINQNTVVAKIVDYSHVLVDLSIPNAQIGKIDIGQPVRVANYAFPDRAFDGEITAINPVLDETTRTFRAIGAVENTGLSLRPGMFVKVEIVVESRRDVILIPRTLVQRRRNQTVVFIEEEGRAQQRDVETGLEDRERVEILSGLSAGDRLITSNYETLRPRTRVRISGQN